MLSKYIPSFELHPSVMANRKHCSVTPIRMCSESGMPLGFDVTMGKPLPMNGSKSVKHCGAGLKMMNDGYWRLLHSLPPFVCVPGNDWWPNTQLIPVNERFADPA